jgi:hypothetical protein
VGIIHPVFGLKTLIRVFQSFTTSGGGEELPDYGHLLWNRAAIFGQGLVVKFYLLPDGGTGLSWAYEQDMTFSTHSLNSRVAHTSEPYFGVRPLEWLGSRLSPADMEIPSVVSYLIFSPKPNHEFQGFGTTPTPFRHLCAKRFTFFRAVSQTQAQDEPAFTDVIQRCHLLSHIHGI